MKNLLRSDRTYVLIGGTGGLGRSMAKWMFTHGASTILLLSRSGSVTGKIQDLIDEASTAGAKIVVRPCDIADRKSVDALLTSGLEGLPPVGGVVHGAMVLRVSFIFLLLYPSHVSSVSLIFCRMFSLRR